MPSTPQDLVKRLSAIPVEALGLSEEIVRILKWEGLLTICHCATFYVRDAHQQRMRNHTHKMNVLMYGDVEAAMKEQGYWPHVMNAEVWRLLLRQPWGDFSIVIMWKGQERDLNDIPLEDLDLVEEVLSGLHYFQLKTIGDWFLNYGYLYKRDQVHGDEGYIRDDLYFMTLDEILLRMKEQEEWPLIAELWYPE